MTATLLPYAPERDVYRLLQVEPSADDREIAVACRRLALAFHPDYNRSPRAHEEMQVVNAVRHLLTDPRSRAAYDGARRRFWYDRERSRLVAAASAASAAAQRRVVFRTATSRPVALPVMPFERPKPTIQVLHERARRAARLLVAAVRGALADLGPPRCPSCHQRVEIGYRYCAYCGAWVGRTARLRGS